MLKISKFTNYCQISLLNIPNDFCIVYGEMLKVYFTASTSYDGEFHTQYKKILELLMKYKTEILSGEQIINDELLIKDKNLSKKQIFNREKELIEKADLVVAEVSKPSHGVGGEIVYALTKDKPVLALMFENQDDRISPMIAGNPSENLFLENYHMEKLPFILKNFLEHIKTTRLRKGKLIVIDGGDGSGKTTQTKLLVEYLKKHKMPTKHMDFPQYYHSFHGKTVAKFLRGEMGNINEVSPYLASLAYALDRASAKEEIENFLNKGGYIISNRYATSNMAHQSAKFPKKQDRENYLKWEYELEYKVHKIPKEDIVIYLYVPWKMGLNLTKFKGNRAYLKGQSDIAERDINHRIQSEKMYLELAKRYKHWVKIDCTSKGKILTPHQIHLKLIKALKLRKILP